MTALHTLGILSTSFTWNAKSEPKFSYTILPVLSSIPFIFIPLKNSLVLADDKHTHNMREWYSVTCCVGFTSNIMLCIQATLFAVLL